MKIMEKSSISLKGRNLLMMRIYTTKESITIISVMKQKEKLNGLRKIYMVRGLEEMFILQKREISRTK